MRKLAWALVIIGFATSIGTVFIVRNLNQVERAVHEEMWNRARASGNPFAMAQIAQRQPVVHYGLPGFVAAAIIVVFGVLLLAIRPPDIKPVEPDNSVRD